MQQAYLFLSLLQARSGVSVIRKLRELPPTMVLEMPPGEISRELGLSEKGRRALEELRASFDPQSAAERLLEKGVHILTIEDEEYPEHLREIPDPPPALYVDGSIPPGPSVALVGSRKASVGGLQVARQLGEALGERGVCILSGLALGVDAAAHEGALSSDGPTVGVLGCGIDVIYPRSNRELFEKVRAAGALISEYYLGEEPLQWRFPARNRIIAGMASAVVVVEAAEKSGALITARHALESGREVWAIPGPIGMPECRGSNRLLADGAGVLWDINEFADAVAPPERMLSSSQLEFREQTPPELPKDEADVLQAVGFESTEVDVIAGQSGSKTRQVLTALAMLELKGYVTRGPGGGYSRVPVRDRR